MLFYIITWAIIYFILILVIHNLYLFFQKNLTSIKTKDYYNFPNKEYNKINNILNSQIISTEAFSPDKKKQKKMNEYNKYIDVTYTFDVEAKTVKILTLLESNAPKKWKKSIAKDIKKGKLANKTDANCTVIGERYLTKKETTKKNNLPKSVAIFEHKEKNIFYTSDNKIEINTREKAINNAISKCWFDPNHKVGDWPSENCEMISVKNINSFDENENNKSSR